MQRAFKFTQTTSRTAFKTCVASASKNNISFASVFSSQTSTSIPSVASSNGSFGNGLTNNNNSIKNNISMKRNINSFGTLSILIADGDDDGG